MFRMPFAVLVLVLDDLGVTRQSLLRGRRPCGRECLLVRREGFGKRTIDFVSPAAVVLDDLICDMRHGNHLRLRLPAAQYRKTRSGAAIRKARRWNFARGPIRTISVAHRVA